MEARAICRESWIERQSPLGLFRGKNKNDGAPHSSEQQNHAGFMPPSTPITLPVGVNVDSTSDSDEDFGWETDSSQEFDQILSGSLTIEDYLASVRLAAEEAEYAEALSPTPVKEPEQEIPAAFSLGVSSIEVPPVPEALPELILGEPEREEPSEEADIFEEAMMIDNGSGIEQNLDSLEHTYNPKLFEHIMRDLANEDSISDLVEVYLDYIGSSEQWFSKYERRLERMRRRFTDRNDSLRQRLHSLEESRYFILQERLRKLIALQERIGHLISDESAEMLSEKIGTLRSAGNLVFVPKD